MQFQCLSNAPNELHTWIRASHNLHIIAQSTVCDLEIREERSSLWVATCTVSISRAGSSAATPMPAAQTRMRWSEHGPSRHPFLRFSHSNRVFWVCDASSVVKKTVLAFQFYLVTKKRTLYKLLLPHINGDSSWTVSRYLLRPTSRQIPDATSAPTHLLQQRLVRHSEVRKVTVRLCWCAPRVALELDAELQLPWRYWCRTA